MIPLWRQTLHRNSSLLSCSRIRNPPTSRLAFVQSLLSLAIDHTPSHSLSLLLCLASTATTLRQHRGWTRGSPRRQSRPRNAKRMVSAACPRLVLFHTLMHSLTLAARCIHFTKIQLLVYFKTESVLFNLYIINPLACFFAGLLLFLKH